MTSERALLERAGQYDRAALGELYDLYAPRIYAYMYLRVGDPCLAEDLTGDVFVRVMQALRNRRGWNVSFRAWLYRIAHNLVVDHYRRSSLGSFVSLDEVHLSAVERDPAEAVQDTLTRERLRGAIYQLTQDQQQVLALRFGEGLTARETAQVMDRTTGAVEALQHRALAALRRILAREAQPDTATRDATLHRPVRQAGS